ncbi:LytR family transcriptional regulator [Fructilactobacillus lindneri]|uniref:Membrane-bound protein lytR n=2 Tax=Fructilactobacillus lindneri TaxID=53444 RepID=A0A0R2JQE3_9LACO|nr:LCP family protein [Fructilactobacillus lindneri]ANZ57311.1 LytR family transcriptional regulator [Fructilactobacillus lindneri]ANZ58576.1 LytR family transcriptional regulator [Fructilactobacillus lindneri]KRN79346.1 membrane-bound protein lytR [Fructilactobacillus lindneri DSM 20690 = JCM 11027]POG98383.1 LytR family transcriptional regulator [Fructilactobacillus lindneri]POH03782.1 LytR family transcriptional regulator [Fructilactobacillus lindneri]
MSDNKNNSNNQQSRKHRRSGKNHFIDKTTPKSSIPTKSEVPSSNTEEEWHPVAWSIMVVLLVLSIILLIFAYVQYHKAASTFEDTYMAGKNSRNVSNILKKRKPFSILLMGTDTGALGRHDKGRTDSMIIATVNPKKKTTYFTSIPRDTKVVVPGDSQPYEKINAAYTIGGPDSATDVVSKLFNVPVDFYAVVNMKGIKQMVNAVGGVDITPNLTFKYEGISVKKGKTVHMNGETALQYTRMRHEDPLGDYGRQIRQRQVLEQVLQKGMKISSASRYSEILKSLQGNLKTNLTFDDMMTAAIQYRGATQNINESALQEDNADVDGVSYQVAPNKQLLTVSNHIRESLGLPAVSQLTSKQRKINSNKEANSEDSLFKNGNSTTKNNELAK